VRNFAFCLLVLGLVNQTYASTLVHNVQGYTMDAGKRIGFVALEFDEGRVTRLYQNEQETTSSKASTRIDGGGATLLPGLIDAHGHVNNLGQSLSAVDLVGSDSEANAVQRTRTFAARFSDEKWVVGRGWNQVLWPDKQFPSRKSLDAIVDDKPVVLVRVDGHVLWVNTLALKLAGIDRNTRDPEGGQIIRDESGAATGVLVDNAMNMVKRIMPAVSPVKIEQFELRALMHLAGLGMTSVHDARVDAMELRAYQALQGRGELPIRVYPMLHILDPAIDPYLKQGPMIDPDHMLDVRSVKISSDGALGSRGAALFEDYSDKAGHKGLLLLSDTELEHHIGRAMAAGYQVNTHAIGDLANARVLDYYERLMDKSKTQQLRHRIEHAQILRLEDVPRFKAAGIIASIQPTHATSDKNMAGDRLGDARLEGAYVWKTLLEAGAAVAGGSDFPVESPNPFYGLHAAVTRQSHDNQPAGGWMVDQKLSREEALSLFTEGAAFAAHQEGYIGRLLPGYYADFILLRENYFTVPEKDIWKNKVIATYVAGREVFRAGEE